MRLAHSAGRQPRGNGIVVYEGAAMKTVQLPEAEEHQNRYVWKITPNLNGTPETL
jgi:hypothetical protein